MQLTLIFTLDDELYGLEIDAIQEIVEDPVLHYIPRAEGVIDGAINFHGQILAVIDLPALLGFKGGTRDHRRVVLTPAFKSLVLSVSGIRNIVKIDLSALQPVPEKARDSAIRGVAGLGETMVNLLDAERVIKQLEKKFAE